MYVKHQGRWRFRSIDFGHVSYHPAAFVPVTLRTLIRYCTKTTTGYVVVWSVMSTTFLREYKSAVRSRWIYEYISAWLVQSQHTARLGDLVAVRARFIRLVVHTAAAVLLLYGNNLLQVITPKRRTTAVLLLYGNNTLINNSVGSFSLFGVV